MPPKKKISVIALDPRAGESYKSDIAKLFSEVAEISVFSMLDGSAAGALEAVPAAGRREGVSRKVVRVTGALSPP